jgi:hypothetical protein
VALTQIGILATNVLALAVGAQFIDAIAAIRIP